MGRGRRLRRAISARGFGFAAAREHLPPLRLRSLGPPVEDDGTRAGTWSRRFADDYRGGIRASGGRRAVLGRPARQARKVRPGTERREDAADRVRTVRRPGDRKARGLGKPETFEFLGFTHIVREDQEVGRFKLKRVTSTKRMREAARGQGRDAATHAPADPRAGTLARTRPARALPLLRGARQHRGAQRLPTTGSSGTGSRRFGAAASAARMTWERMWRLADRWLPRPRILHPWPEQRFDARTQGRSPVR